MNKYDIVFVDIDDTLNPSNEPVSEYTKQVMTKLKENGIKVVVNTGRSTTYAINKSKEANLSEYVISSNGSEVYNYEKKEIVFSKPIPKEQIKKIYDYVVSTKMTIILNSIEERYINTKEYKYNTEPATYFEDIDELLDNTQINQIIILSSNFDRMLVLPHMFKEKYPNLKVVHSSVSLVEETRIPGKEYYHDIVIENTAKSSGIVELLDYLNIDSERAIAIGNGYDDICMADVVGTSVAVENANPILKEVATYITDTAENDGVAKILEKLCFDYQQK